MLPANNDQTIEKYLNEMLSQIGTGNHELQQVREQIEGLKSEYELEREAAKNGTKKEKEAFERFQESFAAGLPGITKGTLESIAAFQRTPPDVIVGSAAVMDICASLASTIGGLSAAFGPVGAVVSALFSTVSMILNFFAPQEPSLLAQIEEMLRDLEAETKASEIAAAEGAVFVYVKGCAQFMTPLPDGGVQDPRLLAAQLARFNLVEGNTVETIRRVRHWLQEEANQDLDGWPEILNLLCQVYMQLVLAVTRQNMYATDEKRIAEYIGHPPDPEREEAWALLQVQIKVKVGNLALNNDQQLDFLKKILPVARMRGTFVIRMGNSNVFAASGRKALKRGEWGPVLLNARRISAVPERGGVDHPNAKYDFWALGSSINSYSQLATRDRKVIPPFVRVGSSTDRNWVDWWAVPAAAGNMFKIYTAIRQAQGATTNAYNWSPDDPKSLHDLNWKFHTAQPMTQLRVATPSADTLPGDPDGPKILNSADICYVTLEGSRDIFFLQDNSGTAHLPIPTSMGSYNGVAVDPYCLWVYGQNNVACVTHASVVDFVHRRRPALNWLGPSKHDRPSVPQSLSACGDGTVLLYEGQLMNGLYRIDFSTPIPDGGLTIKWELYSELRAADRVQKLAILGWPLIDASIQTLTEPAKDVVRPSFLLN